MKPSQAKQNNIEKEMLIYFQNKLQKYTLENKHCGTAKVAEW